MLELDEESSVELAAEAVAVGATSRRNALGRVATTDAPPEKAAVEVKGDGRPGKYWAKVKLVALSWYEGLRSDHTLLSFAAPKSEEESVRNTQVTQLFWNALLAGLVAECMIFGVSEEEDVRSIAEYADAAPEDEPYSIIEAFGEGVIVALVTVSTVLVCRAVFVWANSRKRHKAISKVTLTNFLKNWYRRLHNCGWKMVNCTRWMLRLPERKGVELSEVVVFERHQTQRVARVDSNRTMGMFRHISSRGRSRVRRVWKAATYVTTEDQARELSRSSRRRHRAGKRGLSNDEKLFLAALEALVSNRLHQYITEREYQMKQIVAWLFNWAVALLAAVLALAYSASFGEEDTDQLFNDWLFANGLAFFVIEPSGVLFVVLVPLIINPETRVGASVLVCYAWVAQLGLIDACFG